MSTKAPRKSRTALERRRASQRATAGILEQRSLLTELKSLPTVRLRSVTFHPFVYRRMVDRADPGARPGDVVAVLDRHNELFGHGLFNPRSEIMIRMLELERRVPDERFWQERVEKAVELRRGLLRLDQDSDAYRVVHAEADGLSGLVVDRLGDVLSAEIHSLGMYQRATELLARLAPLCGTRHTLIRVPDHVHGQEGFLADTLRSEGCPAQVVINEFGTRFRVRFDEGHKTGFFCDQRENRRMLASYCAGRSVLDLCCYSGGFAIQSKRLGQAIDVTGVDLDERALGVARENAHLNQVRVHWVHADAFAYMRDMIANSRQYDLVVLDPPKLVSSRRELDEGRRKHFDLNRLAMQLVKPGGLFLSCCCSGLIQEAEFREVLHAAARKATSDGAAGATARSIQILARGGAAPDHPVTPNCPETEYLKVVWMRVL